MKKVELMKNRRFLPWTKLRKITKGETSLSYAFYLKEKDDLSVDINIDDINEQSLNTDTLKFLVSEETGKVNEICMEYYPAE